jgi:phosphoadenosine phosphosulfate reductase
VLPLDRALGEFGAWMTGRKRFHGGDRLRLRVVEETEGQIKFNPLANWGKAELDAYVAEYDLPAHPLVSQGFPSVGCWPCTKAVDDPNADVRAGRWAGQDKTECGIHVARAPGPRRTWAAISDGSCAVSRRWPPALTRSPGLPP